ncbi:PAS domain S-box-containing protein [Desulfocicer vacuolatum DSM 3385]|uniref:histidine kinase n=1 Tax=Desulfocicer vacuolatum DSM 3385 TaxID=1121400 RepID=A0A1W2BEH3_9BACT|nr:PAS domain S-box protein [Desulfocicer vacuolatum]SMC71191.1 PAS domain S-box-containing protein [Desulfocicer vacuolatum DSM 3385]
MKDIVNNIFTQHLSLGVVCVDTSCRITFFNKWLEKHTGWKEKEVLGRAFLELFPEICHRKKDNYLIDCLEKSRSAILSPLVHHHFLDLNLVKGTRRVQMIQETKLFPLWEKEQFLGAIIIIRDFTEQIEHEAGLMEKTRAFNALRNINRMMVRADTREAVFSRSVEILARDMGAPLVWFAHVDKGFDHVSVGAYGGMAKERFESFVSRYTNDPTALVSALELTRQAVKTGKMQVTHRRDHPPEMGRWWDFFKAGKCHCAVAVPLCVEGRVIAVLHIHIVEDRSIPREILALFQELSDDIALTLKHFHDVALRHKAEQKLQAEKERLLVTLKGIGDAVMVCDSHARVILMNPVAETLTGWREEEAVGQPAATVFSIVSEITRKPCPDPANQVIATGKVIGLANHTLLISRSGAEYPIADSAAPVRNSNGVLMGVVLIFRDVTRRRTAEKALKLSEKRFRDITMTMGDLVWEFDNDGIFTYMGSSVEKVLGYDRRELLGRSFWEFIPPEQISENQGVELKTAFLTYQREKRSFFNVETRARDKVGQWHLLSINGIPVLDDDENIMGYRGVAKDITEQKILEKEKYAAEYHFRQAQRMESIGTLAGGIAHDFNNILSAIIGYTELSLDDLREGSVTHENLMEVIKAGNRARELVKQILTFARKSDETRKPLQPSIIAKEVLKFIRSSIPTTIEIRQNIQSESLIMGSATHMHQVLMNLCTNAAQAMEATGGILEMTMSDVVLEKETALKGTELSREPCLEIMVCDTGTGISPDILESIFEPYFTTRGDGHGSGTGMGLALVHSIVKSYGGHVGVESTPGKGTAFTIHLPVIKKKTSLPPLPRNAEGLPGGSERILFVDDEAPLIKIGERHLTALGYQVTTSIISSRALEMFRAAPDDFDLVITDMTMPEMTGEAMALEMMKISPQLPVIICTGYSSRINREKAKKAGIRGFADKPIVRRKLAKIVRGVLDGHEIIDND